jgi:hypothetical protein
MPIDQEAVMHLQNPNPGRDPTQPPDRVPGTPHPVRDPMPGQPLDPPIAPLRDPTDTPPDPHRTSRTYARYA